MILVHDSLKASAERWPGKAALVCDGQVHTFREIDQNSDRMACELQRVGVSRGDRVAIFVENSAEFVISLFGILKAGAVFVPFNPTTKARKLAHIVDDCEVGVIIAQPKHVGVINGARELALSLRMVIWTAAPPDGAAGCRCFSEILTRPAGEPLDPRVIDQDLCTIIYTSGTTGRPKGVMLTHQNVVCSARSISQYLENGPEDVVCCALSLAFSYGLYQVFAMALVGYTLLLEGSFVYPVDVLRRMAECGVTGFAGVPGMFSAMLQVVPSCNIDLSSVRYMTNAAAPMSAAQIQQLLDMFPRMKFYSMHGQTECARTCFMDPDRLASKPGSVGKAMPNTELYLIDESGRPIGPNAVGQMVVRGANVMRGYWGMPEATAEKLRDGPIPGEKVLYTGDLFQMDEEGDLFFVSRMDDIIKCKGEKVSPKEVEDALYELDAIAEAAVIGVDDSVDGQAIKAFVVLREGQTTTENQVRRHCRANLTSNMVPKFVEIRDSLPKTESGKLKRRALGQA